jgi:hypothetical protein
MHFTINGHEVDVSADIRTSLFDLLRNTPGFTGIKKGVVRKLWRLHGFGRWRGRQLVSCSGRAVFGGGALPLSRVLPLMAICALFSKGSLNMTVSSAATARQGNSVPPSGWHPIERISRAMSLEI